MQTFKMEKSPLRLLAIGASVCVCVCVYTAVKKQTHTGCEQCMRWMNATATATAFKSQPDDRDPTLQAVILGPHIKLIGT